MGTDNSSSSLIKEHSLIFTCGFIEKGNVDVQDKILSIYNSWCLQRSKGIIFDLVHRSNNAMMSYSLITATKWVASAGCIQ